MEEYFFSLASINVHAYVYIYVCVLSAHQLSYLDHTATTLDKGEIQ